MPTEKEIAKRHREISGQFDADPEKIRSFIPDTVAGWLWVSFGTVAAWTIPAFMLPTLDWSNYDPNVAMTAAGLVGLGISGTVAALGLSRFARQGS